MSTPRIVNLTPHVVRVALADGEIIEFPPSGQMMRLRSLVFRVAPTPVASDAIFCSLSPLAPFS